MTAGQRTGTLRCHDVLCLNSQTCVWAHGAQLIHAFVHRKVAPAWQVFDGALHFILETALIYIPRSGSNTAKYSSERSVMQLWVMGCFVPVVLASLLASTLARAATTVMPIGDSITRGVEAFSFTAGDYPDSAYRLSSGGPPGSLRSYREHLHDSLIASGCGASIDWVGTQSLSGRTPLNHQGHSGWRADQILAQLPGWLTSEQPDIITLMIGTNDTLRGQSAGNANFQTGTISEIDDILDEIDIYESNSGKVVPVFIGNLVPIYGWWANHVINTGVPADIASEAATLTSLIDSLVVHRNSAGDTLHLVDVNSSFYVNESNITDCQTGTPGDPANMIRSECISVPFGQPDEPDGIHPNLVGERFLADQFFNQISTHTSLCVGGVDTTDPTGTISTPADGLSIAPDSSYQIEGTYADDMSVVTQVEVRLQRLTTSPAEYWNGNTWGTTSSYVDAVLDGSGNWELDGVDLSDYGTYQISIKVYDSAGNTSGVADNPDSTFHVGAATFIDYPASAGLTLPTTVTFTGFATSHPGGIGWSDNSSSSGRVRIAIEDNNHTNPNNSTGDRWWNFSSEMFGGFDSVDAFLEDESATYASWEVLVNNLPPNGDYTLYALAIDDDNLSAYMSGLWPMNRQFFTGVSAATCNGLAVTVDLNLGQSTTPGPDVVLGTSGPDDIRGKAGDDTICGMGGNDFIHGNSGNDWIDGGAGVDNLRGGQGDDVMYTGSGATVGTGSRAFGGTGDDEINGGTEADDLRGGRGADIVRGYAGDDSLTGNDDNDTLYGGGGDDLVKGGNGNDNLNGGNGSDTCDGGGGGGDTVNSNCETVVNVP